MSSKYIWYCAHVINLVIVDMCDSCLDTRNFFGEIQALVEYFGARKRTDCFVNHQKLLYPVFCYRCHLLTPAFLTNMFSQCPHKELLINYYNKYIF